MAPHTTTGRSFCGRNVGAENFTINWMDGTEGPLLLYLLHRIRGHNLSSSSSIPSPISFPFRENRFFSFLWEIDRAKGDEVEDCVAVVGTSAGLVKPKVVSQLNDGFFLIKKKLSISLMSGRQRGWCKVLGCTISKAR